MVSFYEIEQLSPDFQKKNYFKEMLPKMSGALSKFPNIHTSKPDKTLNITGDEGVDFYNTLKLTEEEKDNYNSVIKKICRFCITEENYSL